MVGFVTQVAHFLSFEKSRLSVFEHLNVSLRVHCDADDTRAKFVEISKTFLLLYRIDLVNIGVLDFRLLRPEGNEVLAPLLLYFLVELLTLGEYVRITWSLWFLNEVLVSPKVAYAVPRERDSGGSAGVSKQKRFHFFFIK